MPGIVAGTLLTFIPAAGDYVNASRDFLGGPDTQMMGNVIEANFLVLLNYPAAAALSIILMAAILVLVGIYVKRSGTRTCCERRGQAAAVLGGSPRASSSRTGAGGREAPAHRARRLAAARLRVLAFVFLLIPIAYTFVFSFNDSLKSNIAWRGFTLDKWLNVCNVEGGAVCEAFANSIVIGVVSTVIATTLGTMIAIALVRYRFRARSAISLLLFLPMATPEVVLGRVSRRSSPWASEGHDDDHPRAHDVLHQLRRGHGQGARREPRSGARGGRTRPLRVAAQVFWRITFPLLLPGIMAAALLSFALSFDDFIITNFNSGSVSTFPKYIYISASRGIPAEANVIASAVFIVALALVIVARACLGRRGRSGSPPASPEPGSSERMPRPPRVAASTRLGGSAPQTLARMRADDRAAAEHVEAEIGLDRCRRRSARAPAPASSRAATIADARDEPSSTLRAVVVPSARSSP